MQVALDQVTVKPFESSAVILQDVTLTVCSGECVALIGESGSGKTILGHTLVGRLPRALKVVAGSVSFDPNRLDIEKQGPSRVAVPQYPGRWLPPLVSARALVRQALLWSSACDFQTAQKEAERLLNEVGLSDGDKVRDRLPDELSGGMCQRVALAVALAASPQLCFLDEPTSGLDPCARYELLEALQAAQMELNAIVFATHDITFALAYASRFVVLRSGRVIFDGDRKALMQVDTDYVRQLIDI